MFYTLIKHGFLTNQSARKVLSILESQIHVYQCQYDIYGCYGREPASLLIWIICDKIWKNSKSSI